MSIIRLIVWLYLRAILLAVGLALGVAMITGAVVLTGARRLADLTGQQTTILLPDAGPRFWWASLSTGLGVWAVIGWLVH